MMLCVARVLAGDRHLQEKRAGALTHRITRATVGETSSGRGVIADAPRLPSAAGGLFFLGVAVYFTRDCPACGFYRAWSTEVWVDAAGRLWMEGACCPVCGHAAPAEPLKRPARLRATFQLPVGEGMTPREAAEWMR